MKIITATETSEEPGTLTGVVLKYCELIESRATGKGVSPDDWEPLKEVVAVDKFVRVGAYLEEMNWQEYVHFLTQWAGTTRFEATLFNLSEIGRTVFQEIEERHYQGDNFVRKNVIAVYRFDDSNRIVHLDIYEQARDTGQWIVEAARRSTESQA